MISKEQILAKTHFGLGIYAHILRIYYPGEVVLKIVGRDCGVTRNPFNGDKPTLHVWIHKEVPGKAMSAEWALHKDLDGAIPDGDAFSFAALHYHQEGDELLETINQEMFLHIGEERSFYSVRKYAQMKDLPTEEPKEETIAIKPFSFFRAPIRNLKPCRSANVVDIYKYITSDYAKERTEKLRAMTDKKEAKRFKAEAFDYACFSGTFATRNDKDLVEHSGLICIDFDHVPDVESLFQRLLQDEYFETQLLFRSPSGDGLKWVIPIDITEGTHKSFYESIAAYIAYTYRIDVDINCSNVSRACFLCYDNRAYIYPKLLEK